MFNGMTVWPVYNSLQSFWPGTQVSPSQWTGGDAGVPWPPMRRSGGRFQALAGNLQQARETVKAMHGVWRRFGAVPEGFNLLHGKVQPGQARCGQ
jgi:mannosidase alpha-like ER degradation enhancer 2